MLFTILVALAALLIGFALGIVSSGLRTHRILLYNVGKVDGKRLPISDRDVSYVSTDETRGVEHEIKL